MGLAVTAVALLGSWRMQCRPASEFQEIPACRLVALMLGCHLLLLPWG
jgi:hypothetical protein